MSSLLSPYKIPKGVYAVPDELLDLRSDAEIDQDILHPKPVSGVKNIWFYWHNGYTNMHPYGQRTVRSWHCRFSKRGWVVRVIDREPGSRMNIGNFVDINDPDNFPEAFTNGTLGGIYGVQHSSDLVRFPLLLRYGGVYADVGMIQIGDLDRMWNETVGNPDSPYEVLTYNAGAADTRNLTNYFMASDPNNPLFLRSHKLLLALWAEGGGKTTTDGMHKSPLLKELPLTIFHSSFEENGKVYGPEEVTRMLADYIIQGQAIRMAMSIEDPEDGWNGPKYSAKHVYAIDYMVGSQLINEMTAWNGPRQFELMSLPLPKEGELESEDQELARQIVEACLGKSFGFKLATGLILRVSGDTLSSLWRKNTGADIVPCTYASWLRYGTRYWSQEALPERQKFEVLKPVKVGPLLRSHTP
ncbi:hypothetical protein QQS21_001173 [Conoideocrella luteorostrata]|uniref:Capsule polysaccharide biosynthesis protein n=1 Tax=Conoideocrella luteorostrata TaxID=1105319 RepID=A0AAJ0CXC5_9HYPO|nr:hypothetical protein QQS21_001173 [Conoideocrella luteorostrata]